MNKKGRIENLTPWVKGQSGNPKGAAKNKQTRSTVFRKILNQKATPEMIEKYNLESTATIAELMAAVSVGEAIRKADIRHLQEAYDSAFGKNTEKVESTHAFTKMDTVKSNIDGEVKELLFEVGNVVAEKKEDE